MHIRSLLPADLPEVNSLQLQYAACYPGASVIPAEVYQSPAFAGGKNVFLAFDDAGSLQAYAPLYPLISEHAYLPHLLWIEVKSDPALANPIPVKDLLFDSILQRAGEIGKVNPSSPVRLMAQYLPSEIESAAYLRSKGFEKGESVFRMRRRLTESLPSPDSTEGISYRNWRMESEAEQAAYVAARNEAFPEAPITLAEWQHFLSYPIMAEGTTVAAFDGGQVAGCATVFWNEEENRRTSVAAGFTEYIFVRPVWRGRGIARNLISRGLAFLKEHGLSEAQLEVRADNENALGLYFELGFEVAQETLLFQKDISNPHPTENPDSDDH